MRGFLIWFAVAFAIAHGSLGCAPADDSPDLATLAQPVYVPWLYGQETDGAACSPPWSGKQCFAPDAKVMTTRFLASTCSPWWQARAVEAWNNLVPQVNDLPEWEIRGVNANAAYYWQCTTAKGLGFGAFDPVAGNGSTDDHNVTGWGKFRQYKRGNIYVAPAVIEAQPSWQAAPEAKRQRWARTFWRYLLARQVGHGTADSGLMLGPSDAWFKSERGFSAEMYDRMACYSEDSGTSPDCD